MLILTRRVNEAISCRMSREAALAHLERFGEIRVDFLPVQIREQAARLGITAPPGMIVHRAEIWGRIETGEVYDPKTARVIAAVAQASAEPPSLRTWERGRAS